MEGVGVTVPPGFEAVHFNALIAIAIACD